MTAVHVQVLGKVPWEVSLPSIRRVHEEEAFSASWDAEQWFIFFAFRYRF